MGTLLTLLPVLLLTQIRHMRHLVPLSVTAFSLLGGAMAAVGWLCVIRLYSQSENPLPPPPSLPPESTRAVLRLCGVLF